MTRALYLMGGGPGAAGAMCAHAARAFQELGLDAPRVAYVGVASGDDEGFQRMTSAFLAGAGGRLVPAKLASPRADVVGARAVLEEADVVFVSGGDVHEGIRVLRARDMLPFVRELFERGKPMIGVSAGSIMLAREWISFPDDDDDDRARPFDCIGAAPFLVDAHSEDDDWSELRALLMKVHARGDRSGAVGYGLPKRGALRVTFDAQGRAMLKAWGTPIPKLVVENGHVIHAPPLPPSERNSQ